MRCLPPPLPPAAATPSLAYSLKFPWSLCRQPGGHPQPPAATSQSSRISSRSTTSPPGLSTRLRASTPRTTPPGSKAAAAASVGLPSDMGGAAGTISHHKHHPRQAGGLGGGPFRSPRVPIRTNSGDRSAGYTGSDEGGGCEAASPSAEPEGPAEEGSQGGRRPRVEICEANTTLVLDFLPGQSVPKRQLLSVPKGEV